MPELSLMDRKITVLLRDYGFRFDGGNVTRSRFHGGGHVCTARNLFDAVERLMPEIQDAGFIKRWHKITDDNENSHMFQPKTPILRRIAEEKGLEIIEISLDK